MPGPEMSIHLQVPTIIDRGNRNTEHIYGFFYRKTELRIHHRNEDARGHDWLLYPEVAAKAWHTFSSLCDLVRLPINDHHAGAPGA